VGNSPAVWWSEECESWQPPEDLTVSEWADKYRILSYKAEKRGPWETSFNPVMRRVMDAFTQDCIEEITVVTPTQAGKTDGLLNMLGYSVMQDPGSALVVEPSEDLADEVSTERIDDMIRSCDSLAEVKSTEEKSVIKKKVFRSMTVYFGWAGSPTSLASRPVRYVFFDEVDKYPLFSGKEASPLALGKERTNTFKRTRKVVYTSTPTTQEGYIVKQEEQSQARFRYLVNCPHCGHKQQFLFENVKFGEDHTPKAVEEDSWYECEACKQAIHEDQRMEMVRRGEWYDLITGLPFDECIEKVRPKSVGFQFNRLYTPWFTFGEVAAEFLKSKDIPEKLMNFKNSWMAEAWVERAEQKKVHELVKNKIDTYSPLICPKDTVAVTCGVDPGQGGYWYTLLAWRRQDFKTSPHLLDYGFITGKDRLKYLLFDTSYQIQDRNIRLKVWRKAIDTGGSKYDKDDVTMTADAYEFIREYDDGEFYGTKGMSDNRTGQHMNMRRVDKFPGPNGKQIPGGLGLWMVDTDYFKGVIHMRIGMKPEDYGRFTFHSETRTDFFEHLLSEEKQRNRKTGKWEWVKIKPGNHLLDCVVIAYALADDECLGGIRVLQDAVDDEPVIHVARKEDKDNWITGTGGREAWI